jgi:tetratricopeptide (TPR) repeat protein
VDLGRAIEINPKLAEAYCQRAFAHQQMGAEGGMDRAFADADRAIALDPSSPLAYIIRGNASVVRRRFDDAVADFNRAIEPNPESYVARGCRARARAGLGDTEAAEADIEAALRLSPPEDDRADLIRIREAIRGGPEG